MERQNLYNEFSWWLPLERDQKYGHKSCWYLLNSVYIFYSFQELLHQYNSLLSDFSKVDESSDCMTYNMRSCSSSDLVTSDDGTSIDSYTTSSSYRTSSSHIDEESAASLGTYGLPVGNRRNSSDCLFNGSSESTTLRAEVSTYGRSAFYMPAENGVSGKRTFFRSPKLLIPKC